MADDCNVLVPWLIVFSSDDAAERSGNLQSGKEVGIHSRRLNPLDAIRGCKIVNLLPEERHRPKGMIQPSYIEEVGVAEGEHFDRKMKARYRRVEIDEAIRMAIGQRAQENCLDQAVDRRSGADAERESENGD